MSKVEVKRSLLKFCHATDSIVEGEGNGSVESAAGRRQQKEGSRGEAADSGRGGVAEGGRHRRGSAEERSKIYHQPSHGDNALINVAVEKPATEITLIKPATEHILE
jgi:hypothetical protein